MAKKTNSPVLNFAQARAAMVEGQLRPNKITNHALLHRFATVAREDFVEPPSQPTAYLDQPTSIGHNRELMVPMAAARLLQELNLTPQTRLLVLEGGTGYTAAIAAPLVSRLVFSESNPTLATTAKKNLQPYPNIHHQLIQSTSDTMLMAHYFDAILIDTAFANLPIFSALSGMLTETGILAGIRLTPLPTLFTLTKSGKKLIEKEITETKAHIPPAYQATPAFQF